MTWRIAIFNTWGFWTAVLAISAWREGTLPGFWTIVVCWLGVVVSIDGMINDVRRAEEKARDTALEERVRDAALGRGGV